MQFATLGPGFTNFATENDIPARTAAEVRRGLIEVGFELGLLKRDRKPPSEFSSVTRFPIAYR